MYPNLKLQIFRCGRHQNQLAKAVGMDETVLSKIIHGYRNPTPAQRKGLADYLNADEKWLFERLNGSSQEENAAPARIPAQGKATADAGG